MRHLIRHLVMILYCAWAGRAGAQTNAAPQPPGNQLQRAAALFTRGDWKDALDAYTALATAYPSHALSRFRIGVAQMELGRFGDAEKNLREGERLGIPPAQGAFRLAQLFAESGRADAAIAELRRSIAGALPLPPIALDTNRHFASLRNRAEWPAVINALDALARPCMHDARFREFDFWIGDWDVRTTGAPSVGPAARNTVTLENDGCTVVEHWTAPGASRGQSFNLYDRSRGEWRQTWVDNIGGQHDYHGKLMDGNMTFVGDIPAPNGLLGRIPVKLTFFHLGADSVRQYSEVSRDSGRTWQPNYDLMYVRRAGDAATRPAMVPYGDADAAEIRMLDSVFVGAWLKDDTTKVLSVFAPDAVLLPPGFAPVAGLAAIRAYWWPTDGSHTRITSFRRDVSEMSGSGTMVFVRGTASLEWTYTKPGVPLAKQTSRSTDLIVYAKDPSGKWRVIRQMWSQLP